MPHVNQALPMQPAAIRSIEAAPPMNSYDPLAQASRVVLAQHVAVLYNHQDVVATGIDPEAAHAMRVALRKARTVLSATNAVFKSTLTKRLSKQLRWLAHVIASVRELDVLLQDFACFAAELDATDHAVFEPLFKHVLRQRDANQVQLEHEFYGKKYRRLLAELSDFLTAPLSKVTSNHHDMPILVGHEAGSAAWLHYGAVLRYDVVLGSATSEQLHDLRIACKRLRYTLELFQMPLGEHAERLTKPVHAMQKRLGTIHDIDVAVDQAHEFVRKHGPNSVIARYIDVRQAERAQFLARLPKQWQKITNDSYRDMFAHALAGLYRPQQLVMPLVAISPEHVPEVTDDTLAELADA